MMHNGTIMTHSSPRVNNLINWRVNTLTEKHSDSGKVASISKNEKRVSTNAQIPGPPGSAAKQSKEYELKWISVCPMKIIDDINQIWNRETQRHTWYSFAEETKIIKSTILHSKEDN